MDPGPRPGRPRRPGRRARAATRYGCAHVSVHPAIADFLPVCGKKSAIGSRFLLQELQNDRAVGWSEPRCLELEVPPGLDVLNREGAHSEATVDGDGDLVAVPRLEWLSDAPA